MEMDHAELHTPLANHHPIIIFGVAGCGKSTVAQQVAELLGDSIYLLDADDFHSDDNIAKMASGIPLSEQDREPWLRRLNQELSEYVARGRKVVLACSALRESHRRLLAEGLTPLWCHLNLELSQAFLRAAARQNHFFSADMVRSQFEVLQIPNYGLQLNAALTPSTLALKIISADQKGVKEKLEVNQL